MDPRVEYHEVVSIVSGLDNSCISDQETCRRSKVVGHPCAVCVVFSIRR